MTEQVQMQEGSIAPQGQLLRLMTKSAVSLLKNRGGVTLGNSISRARPVQSDQDVPHAVDVVVIGAGNVGCLTALTLAERGLSVVLCEKGVVAGESSGRSLGYIESLFADPAKLEIAARAKQLWEVMSERVEGHTGYVKTGSVTGFLSEGGLSAAREWLDTVKGMPGIDGRIIGKAELNEKTNGWNENFIGGLYQPSDGCAEPQHFASSVAEAFRAKGGKLFQNCAVREISTQAGKVCGVVTELGEIRCQSVVLTGGAWTPYLAQSLGLDLPQFIGFASIGRLGTVKSDVLPANISDQYPLISAESDIAIRHSSSTTVDVCAPAVRLPITATVLKNLPKLTQAMVAMQGQFDPVFDINTFLFEYKHLHRYKRKGPSPLEQFRILAPEIFEAPMQDAIQRYSAYTGDRSKTLQESWAGFLTTTPDHMPYLSSVDHISGFFIGSGFYNGLTVGPAAAEALADLVMGKTPKIDLSLYRYDRFINGHPIIFRS